MNILCVNSVISNYGGSEFAATNLAVGLADRGHEIHFLGAKGQIPYMEPRGQNTSRPDEYGKIRLHYREFPRTYPLGEKHGNLRKLFWHFQDVAHPANEALFAEVLGEVQPEIVVLHMLTAVGANIWRTIRRSGIPCIQVLHSLEPICLNKARFRGGRPCAGLCVACRIQKLFRFSLIKGAPNFCFVSPSHAMLKEIERYVDLSAWRTEVISNVHAFRVKQRNVSRLDKPRLLYVGRLDPSKGVEFTLESAERAHNIVEFDLDMLGTGSLEPSLRQRYANKSWVRFHGSVDQESVGEFMSRATVLLVPSLWPENAPVVIVHALSADLPIVGSRIGGIPEHVIDGKTGRLLPAGDISEWTAEIVRVVSDRNQVAAWSAACSGAAQRFDPKIALDAYESLIQTMVSEANVRTYQTEVHLSETERVT